MCAGLCLTNTLQAVMQGRAVLNFTEEDHLYMIPQSIFKLHPDYDHVMISILSKDARVSVADIRSRGSVPTGQAGAHPGGA